MRRTRTAALVLSALLAVVIDGEVTFQGFPTGAAPVKGVEGGWEMQDLDAALQQRTTNG